MIDNPCVSHPPVSPGDHVILIDGSSYIFRAYHALPPLTRKSDGVPVGAIAGFCNMLWKLLRDMDNARPPTHVAVILDAPGDTFRHKVYPDYKAHRTAPPNDLVAQFSFIRDAIKAFSIPCVEQTGYEADDLIATYASQAASGGASVSIVASDKDLMQLLDDRVSMYDSMKNQRIEVADVVKKFGVAPDRLADVQALAGDAVDNVPGVPGIGLKTAAMLINEFGDLETLLAQADRIKQPKRRESLINFADQARLSYRLVTLDRNARVDMPVESLAARSFDPLRLIAFLKAMEFNTLIKRVSERSGIDARHVKPDERLAACRETAAHDGSDCVSSDVSTLDTPHSLVESRQCEAEEFDSGAYECVTSVDRLREWVTEIREAGLLALRTETMASVSLGGDLIGLSLAIAPGRACYIPLAHRGAEGLDFDGVILTQIALPEAIDILKPVLESTATLKVGCDLKRDWLALSRYGIDMRSLDDVTLVSYVLDSGRHGHGLEELSTLCLDHDLAAFDQSHGHEKSTHGFDLTSLDKATIRSAHRADVIFRLYRKLKPRLADEHMVTVYETLERPMIKTLARMEQAGIKVDRQVLLRLSGDFTRQLSRLEGELEACAGEAFNPGSPRQIGDILFGRMGLPGSRKTKSGAWATGAEILEKLAAQGHLLPAILLEWRRISKLQSTYTNALLAHVNQDTGRVHTSYALAATITGRLSSSEPNLQNIPVRTKEGRSIRAAFVSMPGYRFVSADYSQIELRVLAHVADIPVLRKAFEDGLDIHAMTASELFGIPLEDVDPVSRRRAKTINFGIIYGISAFGLASQLGIAQANARQYIDAYLDRFPGIKAYMETTKGFCREYGYVRTIFGRKAHYPDIHSKNPQMRAFMERAAINAPIQGSAADIIRRAMIRMNKALDEKGLSARMLMQVHDELVFEVPEGEVGATIDVVRHVMEQAAEPALRLRVPLVVDARAAENWDDAH